MNKYHILAATAAMTLTAAPAFAQATTQPQSSQGDRIGTILRTILGDRQSGATSLDAQWAAGRTPLTNQRAAFDSRVDADVRTGALSAATGARLKADYFALVQLEGRYGADGRFTTQERIELADRYGDLTQILATGDAAGLPGASATAMVAADGRVDFERRVDAALAARRITRVQATRLKADYAAAVQLEASYLRDGMLSARERDDLDAQLDALDARVDGSVGGTLLTPRARLDAVLRALPTSGLTAAAQAQLRIEHGDLSRLEAAYAQLDPSADDRAYLERRLANLEMRARVRR